MNIKNLFLPLVNVWTKHDRAILTGVTIVSTVTAVGIAIRDRPKYEEILWECEEEGCTNVEKAKRLVPATVPLMIPVATSIFSALWNYHRTGKVITNLTDTAASAVNAYMIGKTIQEEYKAKLSPEDIEDCENKAADKRAEKSWAAAAGDPDIIITGHGNDLFYDDWTGHFFYSSWNYIEKVVIDANYRLEHEMWVGLEEIHRDWGWTRSFGCSRTEGWNIDDGPIELHVPEAAFDENYCRPYTIVRFRKAPGNKYERYYH